MYKKVKKLSYIVFIAIAVLVSSCATTGTPREKEAEAQGIVDRARVTFGEFMRDKQYSWLHAHLKDAKGLLIYPQVIKGGFIVGGAGGTGVLVVRDSKTGDWSQPSFYTLGAVTLGLQIGGEASEVVVMAMSRKAIDSLLTSSVKLGADASVALGPVGMGAKGNVTADFISFAKSKGLYAGLNLEGSVVDVRDSLNNAYYGGAASPVDIVIKGNVSNPGSAGLRAELKKAVK
ncbi:MAG TPA: lipid-binding SYLF domain-containing protein [Dissulfurispiraceae bacterium]